jgi:ubiquinone/menaquinone biosynthesis C-methylase UbiE
MSDPIGDSEVGFLRTGIDEKNMNGVDIGCGARKVFPNTIGVDVARMEATDLSAGGLTDADWVGDGHVLPFKDDTLDYVLSRHVLEHMDWKKALTEWFRCLKPSGIMRLVVPNPDHQHHPGHGIKAEDVAMHLLAMGGKTLSYIMLYDNYSWGLSVSK